jgi:glycosyltransferase involved in cell wall biosynthesis
MKPTRLLTIGHSYVLAVNRATVREVAQDPAFQITVAAPAFFHGDLRPIDCESEPPGSPLTLVPVPARFTSRIHVFQYSQKALRELILQKPFDAIHAWEEPYIYAGYQIARLAKRSGARFCFRTAQSLNKRYPPPFSFFEKRSLAAADRWLAGGKSVFDNLVARGYPADRGRVITLAVDTSMFHPVDGDAPERVRRELGLSPPVIGFVGRLVGAKGLRILMRALEGMDANLPWSLLLLGSGEMQAEIEQWAIQRGWQSRVKIFLAKHHEVPKYLAAMDLMVAPSQTMPNWKEQFGRMLIEAFACAVPIIASDSGEIPHVIGDAGLIVPEKDVAGWKQNIELLLRDRDLRERLGEAGRARVGQFSVTELARQFRDFYLELAWGEPYL